MKIYSENLEYQGLVHALDKAKSSFKAAKTEKKERAAFVKATQKEDASKGAVYAARFQFKQAKLKQKLGRLALRVAKLNLKNFVHSFKETNKQAEETAKKGQAIKKEKPKKTVGTSANTVDKTASKAEKAQKSLKVADTIEVVATQMVETKKMAKTKDTKKGAKKQPIETPKVVKVKASKIAKTEVSEAPKVVEVPAEAAKKETTDAQHMAEATMKAVENTPITTQTAVKKEVVVLKRTPINDLTIIEGIGPKVAQLLYDKGVKSFKALIDMPVENIKTWLKENKLQFIDPTTWAEQAKLADEGKMVEFEALKKELKGGKRAE